MPTARDSLSVVTGGDGRIYALGGRDHPRIYDRVEVFDPKVNRWDPAAPMPDLFAFGAAAAGRDGHVYAFGGFARTDSTPIVPVAPSVQVYDPATDVWATKSRMRDRSDFAAATYCRQLMPRMSVRHHRGVAGR